MESIFGLFGLGCGLYCLYGYYLLKFKGEICSSILLPKDVNPEKMQGFPGILQRSPVAASDPGRHRHALRGGGSLQRVCGRNGYTVPGDDGAAFCGPGLLT